MNRSSLALLILLVVIASAHGQSVARGKQLSTDDSVISESKVGTASTHERILAARSIAALKRLDEDVLVYRTLGDFEANGRLARVSFETFQNDLREVTAEVESMLARLSPGRLKTEISNALDSYSDGAFWWQKINQPRVVHVSVLTDTEYNRTPSETAFLSTVPYTVAIHWRQAGTYLKRAEEIQNRDRK